MYEDNNWYGHRYILLKYLNISDKNIYAQIQHGWYGQNFQGFGKKKIFQPPTLVWSRKYVKKNSYKNTIQIGSPFLYLDKILELKKFIRPKGTCLFPSHGHSQSDLKIYKLKNMKVKIVNLEIDYKNLIKKIEKKFQPPFTVCFHESDILDKKKVLFFKESGWNVVSLVKRKDKRSLFKLYKLIKESKNCVFTDYTSSSLLYSLYLKKKVRVLRNTKTAKPETVRFENANGDMFNKYYLTKNGYNIAKKELGYKYTKSREELRKILSINNPFYLLIAKIIGSHRDKRYNY